VKELILAGIFLGNFITTSYRSVPSQTDDSPFNTSTGERVSPNGAAISQDRLCPACRRLHKRCKHPEVTKWVHYGDCLYVEGLGFKVVNDCLGRFKHYRVRTKKGWKSRFIRQDNWIDLWVSSYKEERAFHRQNGFTPHKVWDIKIESDKN
jgi:hypothetical protein